MRGFHCVNSTDSCGKTIENVCHFILKAIYDTAFRIKVATYCKGQICACKLNDTGIKTDIWLILSDTNFDIKNQTKVATCKRRHSHFCLLNK